MMTRLTSAEISTGHRDQAAEAKQLLSVLPKTVPAAKRALGALERDIDAAKTYEKIRRIERVADAIKLLFREVEEVRHQAERVVVKANYRIGRELAAQPVAKGARARGTRRGTTRVSEEPASLKEQVGSTTRGKRLKKLAALPTTDVEQAIETLQDAGKEATVTGVLKLVAGGDGAARQAHQAHDPSDNVTALPVRSYGVIVADASCSEVSATAIVPSIAAFDCVLFLWATISNLGDACSVMSACEFSYKAHLVWAKETIQPGEWMGEQHELLLIGTRGGVTCPEPTKQRGSIIAARAGEQGQKPECFLELIEDYFPAASKVRLNGRSQPRAGWDAWGEERSTPPASANGQENPDGLDPPDFLRRWSPGLS